MQPQQHVDVGAKYQHKDDDDRQDKLADGQPGHYNDLGPLKATNGSFNYTVTQDLDLSSVRAVVIWCRAFSVTVTYAPLTVT